MIYKINQFTQTSQINQNNSTLFFSQNQNNSINDFSASKEEVEVQPSTTVSDKVSEIIYQSSERPPSSIVGGSKCGISNNKILQNLVVSGQQTSKDEFPWLAAMYYVTGNSYAFACTANLISNRYAVTGKNL